MARAGSGTKAKWSAFRNRCRQDYGFDPEADGEIVGGEKLGQRRDAWYGVWERFAESPALYPGIPDLLRRAKPKGQLIFEKDPWPDENDSMESALRAALVEVGSMKPADARQRLEQLETEHGARRGWVWARLGMCPLAERHGASGGAGQADRDDAGRRLGRRDGQAVRRRRLSGRRCGAAGAGVREERGRRRGRPGGGAVRVPAVAG